MKISSSILKERLEELREKLKKEGIEYIIIYSSGIVAENGRTYGYMKYLCNWGIKNRQSVIVLVHEQDPILLVPYESIRLYGKEILWFDDIRYIPANFFAKEIAAIVNPLIKENEKIGYIGMSETPMPLYQELVTALNKHDLIEVSRALDEMMVIKDTIQITYHHRAAEICDAMFETLGREIRKGKRGYQLKADMEITAKYEGCEHATTFLTIGPVADRARYYKEECSRVPQMGDQIIAALFIVYEGHWGHAVRTGTLGNPTKEQSRAFDIVLEMQEAGLRELRPGSNLENTLSACETVLDKYYPTKEKINGFKLKIGHGIGHFYNDPILSDLFIKSFTGKSMIINGKEDNQETFASIKIMPGMLFELHPNIWITHEAAAMIGDMVLITETGCEILNKFPRELICW